MRTYPSCETTSNTGELRPTRSIKNASPFRWIMANNTCSSSYFVVSLQTESFILNRFEKFVNWFVTRIYELVPTWCNFYRKVVLKLWYTISAGVENILVLCFSIGGGNASSHTWCVEGFLEHSLMCWVNRGLGCIFHFGASEIKWRQEDTIAL